MVCACRYKVPRQLKEFKVTCAAADKPLVLIALLQHLQDSRAIVFTGSLVATHRCPPSYTATVQTTAMVTALLRITQPSVSWVQIMLSSGDGPSYMSFACECSWDSVCRLCTLLRCFPGMETAAVEHSSRVVGRKGESEGLAAFKSGSARILVASDALTRGMDIPNVDVVVNYDPAVYPKTYVHRAGRTARAGKSGVHILRRIPFQI